MRPSCLRSWVVTGQQTCFGRQKVEYESGWVCPQQNLKDNKPFISLLYSDLLCFQESSPHTDLTSLSQSPGLLTSPLIRLLALPSSRLLWCQMLSCLNFLLFKVNHSPTLLLGNKLNNGLVLMVDDIIEHYNWEHTLFYHILKSLT